jgi:DNA-binding transcriptional LysR family regulator
VKDDRLLEMRVFKAVVDAGGFTAAAHVLGVSQPFVSQTVSSLERRLGVKLLHRSTRGRRLTEEGERFLASCGRIIDEIEQAEAEISSARSQASGDLRVSAPLAFGMDQLVPRLPDFLTAHPEVKVHLSLSDAIANLIEENVDVAIRMGRLHDSSLMSRKLCNLQRIVVAAPSYIAAHGVPETPQELLHHNCLEWQGPLDHLNRWPFLIDGEPRSILARGNFRSNNGTSLFQLCAAGAGIMRLAEHMALPAIRSDALVPLLKEYQARDDTAIHAVFLPERELLPRIRVFVDYLIGVFRQPPWVQ